MVVGGAWVLLYMRYDISCMYWKYIGVLPVTEWPGLILHISYSIKPLMWSTSTIGQSTNKQEIVGVQLLHAHHTHYL